MRAWIGFAVVAAVIVAGFVAVTAHLYVVPVSSWKVPF